MPRKYYSLATKIKFYKLYKKGYKRSYICHVYQVPYSTMAWIIRIQKLKEKQTGTFLN